MDAEMHELINKKTSIAHATPTALLPHVDLAGLTWAGGSRLTRALAADGADAALLPALLPRAVLEPLELVAGGAAMVDREAAAAGLVELSARAVVAPVALRSADGAWPPLTVLRRVVTFGASDDFDEPLTGRGAAAALGPAGAAADAGRAEAPAASAETNGEGEADGVGAADSAGDGGAELAALLVPAAATV